MGSLYEISEDILRIFNEIELAEGEITEEQSLSLEIKEKELKEKLTLYKNAVEQWEADINDISCKAKQLSERKKVLNNRVDKLKDSMLTAVLRFGQHGKTNMFYELQDARLFTRSSVSVNIDDKRITLLINCIREVIKHVDYKELGGEGILEKINEISCTYYNNEVPFTIDDMFNLKVNISTQLNMNELFFGDFGLIDDIRKEEVVPSQFDITCANSKTDLKIPLNLALVEPEKELTIAFLETNQSLTIK